VSGRRSRVARKAARVVQTELDREFNAGIGALRRERDQAHRTANVAYEKGLGELRDARTEARAAADAAYNEGRAKLLKRLAPKAAA
jgi:hypothetical protein